MQYSGWIHFHGNITFQWSQPHIPLIWSPRPPGAAGAPGAPGRTEWKYVRTGGHIEESTWHTLVMFPDTISRAPFCTISLQFSRINKSKRQKYKRGCSHITWVKFGVFQTLLPPSSAIVSNCWQLPHQLLSKTWGHSAQVLAVWPPQVTNVDESVTPGCWKYY